MGKRARRSRFEKKRTLPGSSPGTMAPQPGAPKPAIHVVTFGPDAIEETAAENAAAIRSRMGRSPVTWVRVEGVGDPATIESIGALFDFHRLSLADVVNVPQRPKGEDYGDTFFLVLQMPRSAEAATTGLELAQVCVFVGPAWVVTFQSCPDHLFAPVLERLRDSRGRLRTSGADYLAYVLVDCVIDSYFPLLEAYGDRLEALENEVIAGSTDSLATTLHDVKHDLFVVRRVLWPHREALTAWLRDDSPALTKTTRVHLRDAVDHVNQLVDLAEAHYDFGAGLMTLHQAFLQQKTNEIMKVLTMLSSVFIPLTFIVGVYGMNFDPDSSPWNMPELRWRWGYPAVLVGMGVIVLGMRVYFGRKGWIGKGRTEGTNSRGRG